MRFGRRIYVASFGLIFGFLSAVGCGGGGGGESGRLFQGTLVEEGSDAHERLIPKHSAGEPLEEVKVCALGECSVTDAKGQWGIVLAESSVGSELTFSFLGHGIDTTAVVKVPAGSADVILDFIHVDGGSVEVQAE